MEDCYQFPGMSVYEHGESVVEWFTDLYNHVVHNIELEHTWRLPNWINNPLIKQNLLPLNTLQTYQLWHDIGKPECREVDSEGKQHFPEHAFVSANTWADLMDDCSPEDVQIEWLIRHDMDAHTVKGEEVAEFIKQPEAISQILTALAEIHSNASYLNQLDSTNFKIKSKQLDKLGRKWVAANER